MIYLVKTFNSRRSMVVISRLLFFGFLFFEGLSLSAQDFSTPLYSDLSNNKIPKSLAGDLRVVKVRYINFQGLTDSGKLICHKRAAADLAAFFEQAYRIKFPMESVKPVSFFKNDDEVSMAVNNTSCFNYRTIAGSKKKSWHSYGLALDVNPIQNPMIKRGKASPSKGSYNPKAAGTLYATHPLVKLMVTKGWKWGGNWPSHTKDYQHFELRLKVE